MKSDMLDSQLLTLEPPSPGNEPGTVWIELGAASDRDEEAGIDHVAGDAHAAVVAGLVG